MTMFKNRTVYALFSALAALMLLTACADPRSALAPPDADVEGIQTVVVFPAQNETRERDLEIKLGEGLIDRLGAIGWYDVLAPEWVTEHIAQHRIETDGMDYTSEKWNETARDIAIDFDADGFILSVITDYNEDIAMSPAYVHPGAADDIEWLADQTTTVTITVLGKLINVHTGATVYERRATGRGTVTEARQLNWAVPESPPSTLIPSPHRRDVSAARDLAMEDALHALTAAILPRASDSGEAEDGP